MIGEKLSEILKEIELTLWEYEAEVGEKKNFTEEGFRAAIKIFACVILDKMYELQLKEGLDLQQSSDMAQKCGEEIRTFVKKFTDIDTLKLYEDELH